MNDGFLWQMKDLGVENSKNCMRCHSPLQETQSFVLKSKNLIHTYPVQYETYLSSTSKHQGIICASCHVRGHVRMGPRPVDNHEPGSSPHGGFVIRDEFENSKFCKACHESPEDGKRINGKKQMEIYSEWSNSKFASQGISCQSCHMPNRIHGWKGIHDKDFVLSGVQIKTKSTESIDRIRLDGIIQSQNIGHNFPGYSVPKVYLRIIEEKNSKKRKILTEEILGRMMDTNHTTEYFDTRLKPGEVKTISIEIPKAKKIDSKYAFEVWIEPDETYQRFFGEELQKNKLDSESKLECERAWKKNLQSGYVLYHKYF
jgi:hypothetical protein